MHRFFPHNKFASRAFSCRRLSLTYATRWPALRAERMARLKKKKRSAEAKTAKTVFIAIPRRNQDASELLAEGKKHLLVGDPAGAASYLEEACRLL